MTKDSTSPSFGTMLDKKKYLYLFEVLYRSHSIDSPMFVNIHYSICRHILHAGDITFLKNTKHMAGLVWWILIGEMEEFDGLKYLLNWSNKSNEYDIKNLVSELYNSFLISK